MFNVTKVHTKIGEFTVPMYAILIPMSNEVVVLHVVTYVLWELEKAC